MTQQSILQKSKALKVCYWFTNLAYYLSYVSAALVLFIVILNTYTGTGIKYMHLPIEVNYENHEQSLPLDQIKSDENFPVVGFRMVKLDVSNYELVAQNMWIPFVLVIGVIYVLYLFRIFLKSVRKDSPFDPANPKRLKLIGYIVVISGPVIGIMNYIYAKIHLHYIDLPGATISIQNEIYPITIFLGLMIIVIAHIFDIAVQMKIEQDMTI